MHKIIRSPSHDPRHPPNTLKIDTYKPRNQFRGRLESAPEDTSKERGLLSSKYEMGMRWCIRSSLVRSLGEGIARPVIWVTCRIFGRKVRINNSSSEPNNAETAPVRTVIFGSDENEKRWIESTRSEIPSPLCYTIDAPYSYLAMHRLSSYLHVLVHARQLQPT